MIEDEPAEFERTLQLSCDRLRRRVDEQKARAEKADAEIARLRGEVASQHEGFERERQALRRHIDRLRRALAAGPAALRGDWVQLGAETAAEVVEAAQAEAMKEKS